MRAIQGEQKKKREYSVCVFTVLRGSARYTAATTVVVSVASVVQESRQSVSSLALPGSSSSVSNTHGQSILEHTVPAEQSSRISPCHRPSSSFGCYTATFFFSPSAFLFKGRPHQKLCSVSALSSSVSSGAADSLGTELASGGRSSERARKQQPPLQHIVCFIRPSGSSSNGKGPRGGNQAFC